MAITKMGNNWLQNFLKKLRDTKDKLTSVKNQRDVQVFTPPVTIPESVLPQPKPEPQRDIQLNTTRVPNPSLIPVYPMQMPASRPHQIPTHPQLYDSETGGALDPNEPANIPLPLRHDPNFWVKTPVSTQKLPVQRKRQIIKSRINKI
ncbi:hypothetical protein M0R04_06635 [Candidatus Dojkabacteria bacterium]|jgi:hypothetical protein|nr:hypothetical protein [Candidatus Dojkabacteria bacterium]